VKIQRVQLSQLPDDPRLFLDPNTDSSSAAPSPAEPLESKHRPSPRGTRRRASARSQAITPQLDGRRFVSRPGDRSAGQAAEVPDVEQGREMLGPPVS
jgi:hypothetical protein